MRSSIFAIVAILIATLPLETHAAINSHFRCGVLADYAIKIPLQYRNISTEMDQPNPGNICASKLNSIVISVDGDYVKRVSTGNQGQRYGNDFSLVVAPADKNRQTSTEEMISALYDESSYSEKSSIPVRAPRIVGGMTYIEGQTPIGGIYRNDFYLADDENGKFEYVMNCMVASNGLIDHCEIGFKPDQMGLCLRIRFNGSDFQNHREITREALAVVESMIIGRASQ